MAVKLVTQETLTDCGLACVAMVSGQSLATVRKVCWRRSKFDPPCRLNFDPGLGAGIG